MAKNPCGKERPTDKPYEIWTSPDGTWEWRVLKKYQIPERESKNEYARWLCAVKSLHTYGSFDIGDVYVRDIKLVARAILTYKEKEDEGK